MPTSGVTAPHSRWAIPAFAAALIALLLLTAFTTHVSTDMSVFLPRAADPMQRLFSEELRSGAASRTVLIGLRADDRDSAAAASDSLATELRDQPQFASVINGSEELPDDVRDFLMRYRYLFSRHWTPDTFSEPGLRDALDEQVQNLRSVLAPMFKQTLAADPTGEFWSILQSWLPPSGPEKYNGVWISQDEHTALLVVQLSASSLNLDAQQQGLEFISNVAAKISATDKVQLRMSGPPVFATASRAEIATEITLLSTAATIVVMLMLWRVYGSFRLMLLGAVPLLTGAVVGTLSVSALFGGVHGVALAFGTTILGIAIDYPIHLFSHANSEENTEDTMRRLWPVMLLGCATTVIGYSAMFFSGFDGLSQIGVFAAAGLIAAALTTRFALPMMMRDSRPAATPWPPSNALQRALSALAPDSGTMKQRIAAGIAAAILVVGLVVPFPWWNDDIQRLSTITPEQRETEGELRAALGAPSVRFFVAVRAPTEQLALEDSEAAMERLDALVNTKALGGYDAAARQVPSFRNQLGRQRLLPEAMDVATVMDRIVGDFPFRRDAFEPFIADINASRLLVPAHIDDFPRGTLKLRLQSLLRPIDDDWIALIPLHEPLDAERIATEIGKLNRPTIQLLDLQSVASTMLYDYRVRAIAVVAAGWIVLWLALAIVLHSVKTATISTLPAALAIALTMSILHITGTALSLFHCVALLLVAGLALDYALFFFRPGTDTAERERSLRAIVICAITTAAVFALLSLSSVPVLRMMGTTVTLGVILAFAATLGLARYARGAL